MEASLVPLDLGVCTVPSDGISFLPVYVPCISPCQTPAWSDHPARWFSLPMTSWAGSLRGAALQEK